MRFSWSERERAINLEEHGLDFVDAPRVFEGLTYSVEDDRFAYGERRFITLGTPGWSAGFDRSHRDRE